jgi:2-polyprenyl-6-methoxyphenol hydroxylase-like FAD-dependent oxidoreductase
VSLGARVTGLELDSAAATVTITGSGGTAHHRARLVVAADGANSNVRRLAGIGHTRIRLSHMVGYLVRGAHLPQLGFGNIFLGGVAPSLAYPVADDAVRLMFDVPDNADGLDAVRRNPAYLGALPAPFRHEARATVETQPRLVSVNHSVVPNAVARDRLVLAGDAAGCCHPLTATGLTASTRDAVRLRDALRACDGKIQMATRRYATAREGPERTREALAEALYRAFLAQTPDMRLLRAGLLRFWKHSRRGRAASMALLSTHEGRMSRMAISYAHVVAHAMITLIGGQRSRGAQEPGRRRAALALWRATARHFYASLSHAPARRA